jgi:hypothetical protein
VVLLGLPFYHLPSEQGEQLGSGQVESENGEPARSSGFLSMPTDATWRGGNAGQASVESFLQQRHFLLDGDIRCGR